MDGQTTVEQLADARRQQWHQAENPVLSIEGLREWVNRSGLVLYGSRAAQLGAPAPSLVEAAGGDEEAARALLARLVAEGGAVPLNLLGAAGGVGTDAPDFVASAGVFSYVFTLRGNKAWKQAPLTSGPVKVSPLALATYEMLAAKVSMSAYDLTTQLGNGVTEGSVLRALSELWGQLRVVPVAQQDGSATLWELTTARFTKQIKSGANAGQPSALSALISLYLGQALAATEDEIESFLSPLASRSRVRDVVHALMSARQLETLVIEGKTLLHVAGETPTFAAVATPEQAEGGGAESDEAGARIKKFAPRPGSKIGTGLRSKPAFGAKPGFGKKPGFGGKPAFGGGDRERRPFKREDGNGAEKPRFDRPWQEKRPAVSAAGEGSEGIVAGGEERKSFPPRTFERRPGGDRPAFGNKFGGKPRAGGGRFEGRKEGFAASNAAGESRPSGGGFTPRPAGDGPRKTFSKPGTFGRKREGFGDRPAFGGGEGRPPRREFGGGEARPPRREFGGGEGRPPRRESGGSERPAGGGFKRPGSYSPRPGGAGSGAYGAGANGGRPAFGAGGEGGGEAPKKVYRKFDAPRDKKPFGAKPGFGGKPAFGAKPFGDRASSASSGDRARPEGRGSFGGKPSFGAKPSFGGKPSFGDKAGPGGKKPFGKSGGLAKADGPFAKFADGKKPFRKPGQARPKPAGGGGGFSATKRKRPGGE